MDQFVLVEKGVRRAIDQRELFHLLDIPDGSDGEVVDENEVDDEDEIPEEDLIQLAK